MLKIGLVAGPGSGKGHPYGTMIPTPTGKVAIEDLKVGDFVFGSCGNPIKVTGVFPKNEIDCYEVQWGNEKVVVDEDHLWGVFYKTDRKPDPQYRVVSTKQLVGKEDMPIVYPRRNKNAPKASRNWSLPPTPILQHCEKHLSIDPYFIGYLIANGCYTEKQRALQITTDCDDFDELSLQMPKMSKISQKPGRAKCGFWSVDWLRKVQSLLGTGKSHEKGIPKEYLLGNPEQRLALLQGLMDGDGSCSERSALKYHTSSNRLKDDFSELIYSFGGYVKIREDIRAGKRTCYSINVSLPPQIQPFRLKRKLNRYNLNRRPLSRTFRGFEHIGMKKTICISVESKDNLYVMSNGLVTHNTTLAMGFTSFMKDQSRNWHFVSEYARDFIDEYHEEMGKGGPFLQMLISDNQRRKEDRISDKAEGFITDSPCFLSWIYSAKYTERNKISKRALSEMYCRFLDDVDRYDHIFFVKREKEYLQDGTRTQTLNESVEIGDHIASVLKLHNVDFDVVSGSLAQRIHQIKEKIKSK